MQNVCRLSNMFHETCAKWHFSSDCRCLWSNDQAKESRDKKRWVEMKSEYPEVVREFICESAEKKTCFWACCFILTLVSCWNDCAHIWMQALLCLRGFRSFCCKMVSFELFSVTGSFRNHSNILFWCSKWIFGAYESQCWKTVVLLFLWKPLSFFQDSLLNTKF